MAQKTINVGSVYYMLIHVYRMSAKMQQIQNSVSGVFCYFTPPEHTTLTISREIFHVSSEPVWAPCFYTKKI